MSKSLFIAAQKIAISDKYDGVAYFSKKFSDKENYYPINICFALLAKYNNEKYTSDIDAFEWTNPMSLREYSMINREARYDKIILNLWIWRYPT